MQQAYFILHSFITCIQRVPQEVTNLFFVPFKTKVFFPENND